MDRVRQSILSIGVTTYLGSLDLLDRQVSFDYIFGLYPAMLRVSKRVADTCVIEDTEYLATRLTKYCDFCQFHLFCSIIELQFIGTENYDTYGMMHDIYPALSRLTLVSKVNGKLISLTPDALYQHFIEFLPLLHPKTAAWSSSLVNLFHNALSGELQESIRLDGYTLPNNSTLTTLSSQTSTLQALREKYVVAHKLL